MDRVPALTPSLSLGDRMPDSFTLALAKGWKGV